MALPLCSSTKGLSSSLNIRSKNKAIFLLTSGDVSVWALLANARHRDEVNDTLAISIKCTLVQFFALEFLRLVKRDVQRQRFVSKDRFGEVVQEFGLSLAYSLRLYSLCFDCFLSFGTPAYLNSLQVGLLTAMNIKVKNRITKR